MSRALFLKENDEKQQKKWGNHVFEVSADSSKEKFFVTFPFPYMNGRLHLGHVFTLLKADVIARYHRSLGKNVLFPFGFHGTGIPITAAASKLKSEFENNVLGKQFDTLKKMDIEPSEIEKFTDPYHWINYFPGKALNPDLPSLGCAIDYRRSFITTDLNLRFDSFVRWQFKKLNEKGYLKFGKKKVIYSIADGQPCSDADRTLGEGVEIRDLKVAMVERNGYDIFVTFDERAPKDRIVKSNKMQFSEYKNGDRGLYASDDFVRGYVHQMPAVFIKNEARALSNMLAGFEEINWEFGSGFYTSNPELVWHNYSEPESLVLSRSGDKCIVANTDQYFILYDDMNWMLEVYEYVSDHLIFTDLIVKELMLETIAVSHPWPCSRTSGLGTRLPIDEKFLIDSLSDSTIYMAYYTISHLVSRVDDKWFKKSDEYSGIEVWEALFEDKTHAELEGSPIIAEMKKEFEYWYPMDLRVSGKDLITNHLTMMMFNHMAIFGWKYMPKSIYANGHILINGAKMSKSAGNFITLEQAIKKYGVTVTRFIAATAGDDTNDGNFNEEDVDRTVLNLYAEIENWKKMDLSKMRVGGMELIDEITLAKIQKISTVIKESYEKMKFRDVIKYGFYELQNIRNLYENPHRELMRMMMQLEITCLYPIIPHFAEYLSETYGIPCEYPTHVLNEKTNLNNENFVTWLESYLSYLKYIVSQSLKKIKNTEIYECELTFGPGIGKYLEIISKFDICVDQGKRFKNGEEIFVVRKPSYKTEILKQITNPMRKDVMITLLSHFEKLIDKIPKDEICENLKGNHDSKIVSYLSTCYPKYKFEIKHSDDETLDLSEGTASERVSTFQSKLLEDPFKPRVLFK